MQRCLVTGANRGLGLEFTRQLLARGARVLACCRDPAHAVELNALRQQHGEELIVHALDVADAPLLQDCRNINHETNEGKRLILI